MILVSIFRFSLSGAAVDMWNAVYNLMEALGCERYPGKRWREQAAAAELSGDGLTGKGEKKEKVYPGRCAPGGGVRPWTWNSWNFIMVPNSGWGFSTCLWDWKVRKGQGQIFLQALPAAGDGVCCPLQSLTQVMDDCGSFKSSDLSVGGESQRWRVTVKSIIRTNWTQCYYYLSQEDTVYKVKLQHLKFSSLTESFVHSLNNNLVKESVLDLYVEYLQWL